MYETDLMRQILSSQKAQEMSQDITPRYGAAYCFLWLLQAIGQELDTGQAYAQQTLAQTTPQTATWALTFWEAEFGITPTEDQTLAQRRANVVNKMIKAGPMNPARLASIASAASGYSSRIAENTAKNTFTLYVNAEPSAVNEASIRRAVDKAKPARLIYNIGYERYIVDQAYGGGIIRKQQEINLRQGD